MMSDHPNIAGQIADLRIAQVHADAAHSRMAAELRPRRQWILALVSFGGSSFRNPASEAKRIKDAVSPAYLAIFRRPRTTSRDGHSRRKRKETSDAGR